MSESTDGSPKVNRMEALMRQAQFTPRELALVLDMGVEFIEQEAFRGHLKAEIVNHDIIGISREAALEWLRARDE